MFDNVDSKTIEIIVMFGVWGNLILQSGWFVWSKSIHDRKHKEDE